MINVDILHELASAYGIASGYTSSSGEYIATPVDTLIKLLHAMGAKVSDNPTREELDTALNSCRNATASRPLPPAVVCPGGVEKQFIVHVHDGAAANVHIELEDGTTREVYQDENWNPPVTVDSVTWGEATFHIPGDLPLGYHRLLLQSEDVVAESALIITPAFMEATSRLKDQRRFGVMAQLYSVRSKDSWGIGDFHDLGQLAETLATTIGADFIQINPLHAAEPMPPVENSPYLPSSRRYVNPIYIRVEDTPEYATLDEGTRAEIRELAERFIASNSSSEVIDRNPIYEAKLDTLTMLFHLGLSEEREAAFAAFIEREGQGLVEFAEWNAQIVLSSRAQRRHEITSDASETTRFMMWLQFLCDEQLGAAQQRALDAGMSIGIVTDLAVGVHPGGADAYTLREYLAPEASVGAPPDPYNQQGQDWSQPPWNPTALAEAGYRPWRDMLATVLRHAGGVRVDHILGMFRLFWMPRLEHPSTGTYVAYDFEAMLGILALEAERKGAVLIGEDLGTFEPWVQGVLAQRGVLGTNVLWFESRDDQPKPPEEYRFLSMASVGTHDLPPTAGYLRGEHIRLREALGVLTTDPAKEERDDLQWQNKVLETARLAGCFDGMDAADQSFIDRAREDRGNIDDLLVGLHRFIARTSSALTCTNLVDLVGDQRVQNQPGTNADMYPNWRIPLCNGQGEAVLIEDLPHLELFQRVGAASARPKKGQ